ncbi:MAG: ATP-binding protein, partial [Myxococcales bacterium]|nr:ATP-binding protein [Myxococcales bacterium]
MAAPDSVDWSAHEARAVRDAMKASLPRDAARYGSDPPDRRILYVPEGHARALDPDNMVVRGIRGAGKTFWWQCLQDPNLRAEVARRLPRTRLGQGWTVTPGFGGAPDDRYPTRDLLAQALARHPAQSIWRAVVLWAVAPGPPDLPDWLERIAWTATHPQEASRLLRDADLAAREDPRLIVFDAVDLAATDWEALVALHRGLLEVLLDLRHTAGLRGKAFLRADLLEEPRVTGFPDASKLLRDVVDLRWTPTNLYGLLWQYLGNVRSDNGALDPGAACFRQLVAREVPATGPALDLDPWDVPEPARVSEAVQERLMTALAGRWMGSERRRGKVYTWLPNHLLDGRRQVSPRSFLVALQAAAEETRWEHDKPLDWQAISSGVAAASRVRVSEISREEHGWVRLVVEPLRGLRVPVEEGDLLLRWAGDGTVDRIRDEAAVSQGPPPRHLAEGERGLLTDLVGLGIAY